MRKIIVIVLMLHATGAFAQSALPPNLLAQHTIDRLSGFGLSPADLLYGVPLPEGTVTGSSYLHEDWRKAALLLYEGEKLIEGFPVRIDLALNQIEIKPASGIKVLGFEHVKSIAWITADEQIEYFINAKDYVNASDNITGFFQVVSDGNLPLLRYVYVSVKEPDYNVAMNVGSLNHKLFTKQKYFMLVKSKAIEVPSNRKKLVPFFEDRQKQMESFLSDKRLSPGNDAEIKIIFDYYNQIHKEK
ncbi:MAG TPA: hypothetical protein VD884_08685 [Ohtaekwangia sp.]|nr:hypothetical protein [Ohtaekwangia sp.]